jgi:hypothetical protein
MNMSNSAGMQWEYIGKQELKSPGKMMWGGYIYQTQMWRTPVPGGWLLMALNSRSNSPDPVISFYPDDEHVWKPSERPQEEYLLRASVGAAIEPANELLRIEPAEEE